MQKFCKLIEKLDKTDRASWDQAQSRTFHIGIDGGLTPNSKTFELKEATVKAVAALNARILITVYSPAMPVTFI
ncbi:MAG: hypothetical protein FJW36_12895 [Acidobacteria bacterium]|nr:hypothetical protein [Acidobacteriota bacterium]